MKLHVISVWLVLFLFAGLVSMAPQANAQSTGTYIPSQDLLRATILSNGSIVPATANITQSGNTYMLTSDLDGYVSIEKNECVFDGNGHTVYGVYGPIPSSVTSQLIEIREVTVKNTVVVGGGIIFYGYLKSNIMTIINNTVNSGTGIDCSGNGNLISKNSVNKGRGICIAGGNNIVSANNLQGCDQWANPVPSGISVSGSNNQVFVNIITQTRGYAIDIIRPSSRNVIAGNQIENNQFGIHTSYAISQGGAEGNLIYKNNFVENGQNVYNEAIVSATVSANFWDDGIDGNYWSNYNGQGPYVIDEHNTDNHPLVSLVDISKITSESLSGVPSSTATPTTTPSAQPVNTPSPTPSLFTSTPTESPFSSATNSHKNEPVYYLLPLSIIIAVSIVPLGLLYRRHRKTKA